MRKLLTILAVVLTASVLNGCSGAREIKVTSCSIVSISPNGLKSVNAVLDIGVSNPMMALTVTDISGAINKGGREFATFRGEEVNIPGKSEGVYTLPCSGTISEGIGLSDLLMLALKPDFGDMTIDICVNIKLRSGLRKALRFNDIKVTDLMESAVSSSAADVIANENMI